MIVSDAHLQCEICEAKQHLECCKLDESLAKKINRFLCLKCEDKHGELTEWQECSILTRKTNLYEIKELLSSGENYGS